MGRQRLFSENLATSIQVRTKYFFVTQFDEMYWQRKPAGYRVRICDGANGNQRCLLIRVCARRFPETAMPQPSQHLSSHDGVRPKQIVRSPEKRIFPGFRK